MSANEEQELEKLARDFPVWSDHLVHFREKHPDMPPKEIMRKAGFTYRMRKGKLFRAYWKPISESVLRRVMEMHGIE